MRSLHFETFDKQSRRQYLGNEKIFTLRIPFGESTQTFTFPKVSFPKDFFLSSSSFGPFILFSSNYDLFLIVQNPEKSDVLIQGIQHYDYRRTPSKLSIKSGGIGSKFVKMTITSHPGSGISSIVHFYGVKIPETTEITYL